MEVLLRRFFSIAILLAVPLTGHAGVYRIAELNVEQIRALDRSRAVIILVGGILEQHGPYLPTFTDGYWNEHVAARLAAAIHKRGYDAVLFPTIPLGNGGANDIGAKFSYPGTYAVRFETLRSIFMDVASEFGEQGFRRIFVVHLHGAPNHNRALDQAGDYFHDTYGGTMVNLTGIMSVIAALDGEKSDREREEDGMVMHAGMDETSMMLAIKPQWVSKRRRHARPIAGKTMDELIALATKPSWPGYFGSPRLAAARRYAAGWARAEQLVVRYAIEILGGLDTKSLPRFADEMMDSAPDVELDKASLAYEEKLAAKQREWLRSREKR